MTKTKFICGIDEAGRGPLAGPVYAACVHIPEQHKNLPFWQHVTDSKKLSARKREEYEALNKRMPVLILDFDHVLCHVLKRTFHGQ